MTRWTMIATMIATLIAAATLGGPAAAQGLAGFDPLTAAPPAKRKKATAPPLKKKRIKLPAVAVKKPAKAKRKGPAAGEANRKLAPLPLPLAELPARAAQKPEDEGVTDLVPARKTRVVMPTGATHEPLVESAAPVPLPEPPEQPAPRASSTPATEPRPAAVPEQTPAAQPAARAPDLGFDLLGSPAAPAAAPVDPAVAQTQGARRALLTLHQGVGYVLLGGMAGSVISGQLSYSDRFGGPSTGRYEKPHAILTGITLGTFAGAGLLALLAPVPPGQERTGIDRVWIHEAGMIGATAGMVAEGALGILTAHNEGASSQSSLAATHLAIGYLTLAFMSVAVGALVF